MKQGSVYKRRGMWVALLPQSLGRKYLGGYPTREEARNVLRAALAQIAVKGLAPTGGPSLSAIRVPFFKRREVHGIRGLVQEKNRWSAYISTSKFYQTPLEVVVPRDVRQWRDGLLTRGLANATVMSALNLLRAAFNYAVEEDLISNNPVADVRVQRRATRTAYVWTALTVEEQYKLVSVASELDRIFIAFAIGTGLRLGEQLALRTEDVLEDKIIVRFGSRGLPTKSGHIREVPLFGIAQEVVRAHQSNSMLYFGPRGRIQTKVWKKYLKAAGISRRVRWHDLRHTFASSLVSGWWGRKFSLDEVRELLGHSSVKVTERYAHLAGSSLQKAVAELEPAATILLPLDQFDQKTRAPGTNRTCDQRFRNAQNVAYLPEIQGAGSNWLQLATDVLRAYSEGSPNAARLAIEFAQTVIDESIAGALKKAGHK